MTKKLRMNKGLEHSHKISTWPHVWIRELSVSAAWTTQCSMHDKYKIWVIMTSVTNGKSEIDISYA